MSIFSIKRTSDAMCQILIPDLVVDIANFLMVPGFVIRKKSLREQFIIPDIRTPDFWIVKNNGLREMVHQIQNASHSGLTGACVGNHMELIKTMLKKGAKFSDHKFLPIDSYEYITPSPIVLHNNWDYGLELACVLNNWDLMTLTVNRGANNFSQGLVSACHGGHLKMSKLMIMKGGHKFNWGLRIACEAGHLKLVKLMVEKGATYFTSGLKSACRGGHLHVVKFLNELLVKRGISTFYDRDKCLTIATKCGYTEIVEYLTKNLHKEAC